MRRPAISPILTTLALSAALALPAAGQTVIYDTLDIANNDRVNQANGSAIGGLGSGFAEIHDLQVADDFEISENVVLTRLTFDYISPLAQAYRPKDGVLLQIYRDDNGRPGEGGKIMVAPRDISVEGFQAFSFRNQPGTRVIIDMTRHPVNLAPGRWWVSAQPVDLAFDASWYHAARDTRQVTGIQPHVRDGAPAHNTMYNGPYAGAYNTFSWMPIGDLSFAAPGDWSMQVVGHVGAGHGLGLMIHGDPGCPGRGTVNIMGATPNSRVHLIYSNNPGAGPAVPGCSGLNVDLRAPAILGSTMSNSNGHATFSGTLPPAACGRIVAQAVEQGACRKSNLCIVDGWPW